MNLLPLQCNYWPQPLVPASLKRTGLWSMLHEFVLKHYRADESTLDEFTKWHTNRRSF
ncbi:hypothetical protein Bca4012_042507 [Brassica carinata]|uniref:BnaCnng11860D protein n=1 Tax=Brassica napus TaxID=3708 RepID=A0A078I1S8_BRANA|nr:BnaCnng11860D [Brassica napus]